MIHVKNLVGATALACSASLMPSAASATTIDLTVTKKLIGPDTGQTFEFNLYEPGNIFKGEGLIKVTPFELEGDEFNNFTPSLGFFVTENAPGSNQLVDIEILGDYSHGFGYDSISWVGAANKPELPRWLEKKLPGVVPDNGAGGVCYSLSCSFDVTFTNTSEVPLPAAAWLFGSGLIGLAGIARRKKSV